MRLHCIIESQKVLSIVDRVSKKEFGPTIENRRLLSEGSRGRGGYPTGGRVVKMAHACRACWRPSLCSQAVAHADTSAAAAAGHLQLQLRNKCPWKSRRGMWVCHCRCERRRMGSARAAPTTRPRWPPENACGRRRQPVGAARAGPRRRHRRRQHPRLPRHRLGEAAAKRHQLLPHVPSHHRSHGRRARHAPRHPHPR